MASVALVGITALFVAGWLALRLVPLPAALFRAVPPALELVDRNGESLRSVRAGEVPFNHRVAYSEIPQSLVQATLAAEDRRFWKHPGLDWRATLRACSQFIRFRRVVSGASTITQQLIKLAEPRPRTFRTKVLECAQALRLEQLWTKQQILAEYLNRLDYGNLTRGCAAAAKFYFGKPLRDLSPAECALLASLPQAPSRLNPRLHFERAVKRQQWVLRQMREVNALSAEEFHRAVHEELRLAKPERPFEAPHFVDLLLQSDPTLARSLPEHPARTTLDLNLNRFAERTLQDHLAKLQSQHVSNGAVVIIESRTGDVLALVGSEDYFAPGHGQVNGAWAPRSAGSTFKPFTYLLALEQGATAATIVADVPAEFATASGLFAPVNYNRHCYGPMRYRLALANSLNISAVKVLASIGGAAPLQARLQACGLSTLNRSSEDYGLGLTIGNAEARLLELADAYACLARLGERRPYQLLLDPNAHREASTHRFVADPAAAYLIADILSDNEARLLAFGDESSLRFDFPVACKTGTSSDFRDNWAFGYTPEFTVGVWVGNFDGSPMHQVSGVTGAAPILHELFDHLHIRYGTSWYSPPSNIVQCAIHPITGKRLSAGGATATSTQSRATLHERQVLGLSGCDPIIEKFLASNLPSLETTDDYEPVQGIETNSVISTLDLRKRRICLGPEYRDWLTSADNWLGDRARTCTTSDSIRIVFPLPGTRLYLDPDLPNHGRKIYLRVEGPAAIEWRSKTLNVIREGNRQVAFLAEGRHELLVSAPGKSAAQQRTWIEVLSR